MSKRGGGGKTNQTKTNLNDKLVFFASNQAQYWRLTTIDNPTNWETLLVCLKIDYLHLI
jgi:hypothetical protein